MDLVVLAVAAATAEPAPSPGSASRVQATVAGLQHYWLNTTGSYYTCCGQTGGAGGAKGFGCACGRADMKDCLNCYRWWAAQGMEAFVAAENAGLVNSSLVLSMAEAMFAQSPYNKHVRRASLPPPPCTALSPVPTPRHRLPC